MRIYIGADHQGFGLKAELLERLKSAGYSVEDDSGTGFNPDDDFPVFASRVVNKLLSSEDNDPRGILICGSGQGMAMTANRYKGIRAAVVWNKEEARLARNDDDSNVLALPARLLKDDPKFTTEIVEVWLKTAFENLPRRVRRIKEMDNL